MIRRTREIPPLTSLRTFEAVVRFGSFGAAADRLGLTPAAISYQIKSLEAYLRVPLFRRQGRQMTLTAQGSAYGAAILKAFTDISRAADMLKTRSNSNIVRVGVVPSFVTMANLANGGTPKYGTHKFELQLEVRDSDVDFETETIDAAIHVGYPSGIGLSSHRLFRSRIVALATRKLWDQYAPVTGPRDLLRMPLIEFGKTNEGWKRWFSQIDPSSKAPTPRLLSDTLATGIQMAEANLGVILAPLPLMSHYLSTKRLESRLSLSVEPRVRDYYLVYRKVDGGSAKIKSVRKWIDDAVSRLSNSG